MDVTTNARFARIKTDSADPGLSPADSLRMYDDELQEKADRLARSFGQRLTPEQEQVKELTGFTMDHLQALRHLQQRAELCRKAQK